MQLVSLLLDVFLLLPCHFQSTLPLVSELQPVQWAVNFLAVTFFDMTALLAFQRHVCSYSFCHFMSVSHHVCLVVCIEVFLDWLHAFL